jgi:hypothetical protein
VRFGCRFITRATVAEIVLVKNSGFFEQANGSVNRGNRNARVDSNSAFVEAFDVRMVLRFGQDPRDYPPLIGNPQTALDAERLNIDKLVHVGSKK